MDIRTLMPPFWRLILEPGADFDAHLAQLFAAVNAAVQDFRADANALLRSGAVSTAQDPFLQQWEKLYGATIKGGQTPADRRSAVMAKMRGGGICTPGKLRMIAASFYGGEVEIAERTPNASSFTVKFVGQQGTPAFLSDVTAALTAAAPAHLKFVYEYRYLLIREVSEMTLEELKQTNLDYFAGG